MDDLKTYESYFENEVVGKYEPLKGFFPIDMFDFDNFVNNLKTGKIKQPCLVLESFENSFSGTGYNVSEFTHGAIIILDKFDVRKKEKEVKTLFLQNVRKIIKQVLQKMIEDSNLQCSFLQGLDISSIKIAKTDLIAGQFLGYRMEFSLVNPDETQLDKFWIGL